MAVAIRLKRMGKKKKPCYRVVVADSRVPRDGKELNIVGYYQPCTKPTVVRLDEQKILSWLERGAQPTESVKALLTRQGILAKFRDTKTAKKNAD